MLSLHQTTTTTTTTIMPCGFCRNLNLPASIVNSHFARTCPRLAQTECLLCGKKGHTASRCPMKLKESWNKPRVEKSTDGWSVKRGAIISTSSIPFIVTNKPQNRFNTIAVPEEVKETRNLFKESPPAPKLTGAWSKGAPKDKPKPMRPGPKSPVPMSPGPKTDHEASLAKKAASRGMSLWADDDM